jgi:Tfp pilus assembly protein PilN
LAQAELLTKQLSEVHDEAETVIRLKDELAKAQERLQVLSSASESNAETASLMEAMQGLLFFPPRACVRACVLLAL